MPAPSQASSTLISPAYLEGPTVLCLWFTRNTQLYLFSVISAAGATPSTSKSNREGLLKKVGNQSMATPLIQSRTNTDTQQGTSGDVGPNTMKGAFESNTPCTRLSSIKYHERSHTTPTNFDPTCTSTSPTTSRYPIRTPSWKPRRRPFEPTQEKQGQVRLPDQHPPTSWTPPGTTDRSRHETVVAANVLRTLCKRGDNPGQVMAATWPGRKAPSRL